MYIYIYFSTLGYITRQLRLISSAKLILRDWLSRFTPSLKNNDNEMIIWINLIFVIYTQTATHLKQTVKCYQGCFCVWNLLLMQCKTPHRLKRPIHTFYCVLLRKVSNWYLSLSASLGIIMKMPISQDLTEEREIINRVINCRPPDPDEQGILLMI